MTLRITLSALLLATSACLSGTASADEPAPTAEEVHRFCVYSGNCSRSIRERGTYATAAEAVQVAAELRLRKPLYLWVAEGDPQDRSVWSLLFAKHDRGPKSASVYEYRRTARCNSYQPATLKLTQTTEDLAQAALLAGESESESRLYHEVIYHFAPQAKAE